MIPKPARATELLVYAAVTLVLHEARVAGRQHKTLAHKFYRGQFRPLICYLSIISYVLYKTDNYVCFTGRGQ